MRRTIPLLLLVMVVIATATSTAKAQSEAQKKSLRGMKGVFVVVVKVAEDVEQQGLWTNQLQTDAELKLRKAGIHVATQSEWVSSHNIGELYIKVEAHQHKVNSDARYSFVLIVQLWQDVRLARDPSVLLPATTYEVPEIFGTIGEDHLPDLRNDVNDMVDRFLNDYLAMNPK